VASLVESKQPPTLRQRALSNLALEQALKLPVDVVATQAGTKGSAFARIGRGKAQALDASA
jgi:hypothetical protein